MEGAADPGIRGPRASPPRALPVPEPRHQRIGGYQADCEKYNWATMLGWRVIRLTSAMITYDCVESIIDWMGAQNDSI